MKRALSKAGLGALAAAMALGAGLAPTVAPNTAAPGPASVARAPSGEKQAPAPAPTNAPTDLAFLAMLGAPMRGKARTSGCPWPGRKVACMLRRSGRVRKMRH